LFMTKRPDTDSLPIRTQEERALDIEILIVDDDRPIADLLKDALSGAERRVDVCYEGLSAIEKIQEKNYDLIIVDLVMPRVDGLELLRYAKGIKPDVIVIIITGHASLETAISAIREGAYNYIRKPFKLEELQVSVDNAIEKIRLNRENQSLLKRLNEAYKELTELKNQAGPKERIASINFFSSNMPSLHYFCEDNSPSHNFVNRLGALSSLKEKGLLTDREFTAFKGHLLKILDDAK